MIAFLSSVIYIIIISSHSFLLSPLSPLSLLAPSLLSAFRYHGPISIRWLYKQVDMSFFRNLERVVPSKLFTAPNSLLLQSKFRPLYVPKESEPSIDHLHTVKALIKTIQALQAHLANPSYEKAVKCELEDLHAYRETYAKFINRFVTQGGLLTGEGIANLYYSAESLQLSPKLLEDYVHRDIPSRYKFMSRQNLEDLAAGLQKYQPSSPYLSLVKEELSKRSVEAPVYVEHQYNQSSKYDYSSNQSNHPLVATIANGSGVWRFYLTKYWGRLLSYGRVVLHSD